MPPGDGIGSQIGRRQRSIAQREIRSLQGGKRPDRMNRPVLSASNPARLSVPADHTLTAWWYGRGESVTNRVRFTGLARRKGYG